MNPSSIKTLDTLRFPEQEKFQLHYAIQYGKWTLKYGDRMLLISFEEAVTLYKAGRSMTLETQHLYKLGMIPSAMDVENV